jgi:hypothetical protein
MKRILREVVTGKTDLFPASCELCFEFCPSTIAISVVFFQIVPHFLRIFQRSSVMQANLWPKRQGKSVKKC